MAASLKTKTIHGLIWNTAERFSIQGVQLLVTIVIARILSPKDFGLIGMLAIFLAVSQTFIDGGFSQALIRKQDRSSVDNSTVFYFNVIVSFLSYSFLYLLSPWVASFYNEPALESLMRVLCIVLIIDSFGAVQKSLLTASLNFKILAKVSFIAALLSGCIGVLMATIGYGVWALVCQSLLNALINTILLWTYSSWYPKWEYSWSSFKELFSFGSRLLASYLLGTVVENLNTLVIGKVFNASSLGHYAQADRFAKLPSAGVTGVLRRVTYPVLCNMQDDDKKLRDNYRVMLRLSAFIIFPLMCFLAGISRPLISLILGEKWEPAAILLIPLCFSMMWYPIHAINLNLLQVKGRSDLFFKLEIIKRSIGVAVLLLSVPFGLVFLCYSGVVTSIISLVINTYYTGKLISVGFLIQMHDLSETLVSSLILFILSYLTTIIIDNVFLCLVICLLISIISYLGIAYVVKSDSLFYLLKMIKS